MLKTKILFLCTGNSCRSQIAEAIANHYFNDVFEAVSAGTKPAGVNPLSVKVMAEEGIDISKARSKNVSEFAGRNFDYVITLCGGAKETCPVFPASVKKLHWDLPDPAAAKGGDEEVLAVFRAVGKDIKKRLSEFAASLKTHNGRKPGGIDIYLDGGGRKL